MKGRQESQAAPATSVNGISSIDEKMPKKRGIPPVKLNSLEAVEADIIEAIRADQGYRAIAAKYARAKSERPQARA